nr:MAG TPA: Chromatin remodeling complex ATPase [Caudoviricetes sp.]
MIERCVENGERVLVLAHRSELLDQASDKLQKTTGLQTALEKAQSTSVGTWNRVVVASVQTLQQEKRLSQFSKDYFDTIVIDEAHHSVTGGYQTIIKYFDKAKILGVTATADRADNRKLGEVFQSVAYEYSLATAIRKGYLSKIMVQTIPLEIDLKGIEVQAGDYSASSVGTALDPYLDQIADKMMEYCKGRKTLVFLPLITTSKKFTQLLIQRGFKAHEVNGQSEDREQVKEKFAKGEYDVICNSMLWTEGFDEPSIDCVIMLRPTKVRSLYAQAVGRGTRLFNGKKELLILDFLWLTDRLDLCRPANIICRTPDVAKKMTDNINESGELVDLLEAETQAESDVVTEREEALARELEAMRKKKSRLVDPLQYEMSIQDKDLINYVPQLGWECLPPTEKQIKTLSEYGISFDMIETQGKANLLLNKIANRRSAGLSSPKQIRLLERYGFKHVGMWTMDEANKMISRISYSGWRVPQGINPSTYLPSYLEGQEL